MWVVSGMVSGLSLAPVYPWKIIGIFAWAGAGLLLLALVVFGIRLYRMSMEPTGGTDATPDDCWRFGVIYYNPSDPALMVEKRDGPVEPSIGLVAQGQVVHANAIGQQRLCRRFGLHRIEDRFVVVRGHVVDVLLRIERVGRRLAVVFDVLGGNDIALCILEFVIAQIAG